MKVMAVSDLHGNLDGLDPAGCDVVAVAGDFSKMYGFGYWHVYRQAKWIKSRFFDFVSSYPDVEFVVVPGNHDLSFDSRYSGGVDWRADLASRPGNLMFLLDSGTDVRGLKFWGTPWIPPISDMWAFESTDERQKAAFSLIPAGLDVLISHSPPRIPGSEVDISDFGKTKSRPFGSWALADSVSEKKPRYVFCGHIHTGDHSPVEFVGSTVYNVSRLDERYDIRYEPLILDIQSAEDSV